MLPLSPVLHEQLASALSQRGSVGDLDAAIKENEEAIRLKPSYAEAYFDLGVLLVRKGDIDNAMSNYRSAIKLVPRYVAAHINLGSGLESKGDFEGAMQEYQKAVAYNPRAEVAHNNIGFLYLKMH